MRATRIYAPFDIRVEEVPDPQIQQPTDVIVRVSRACICGSDLWPYQGASERAPGQRIGHEFLGVVTDAGREVRSLRPGQLVVAPFVWADGQCAFCRDGHYTSCPAGGFWGEPGSDGGQGESVRVPFADATLVALPDGLADDQLTAILALSDVMATGHHAAMAAGVGQGGTVAVVGDGAVGLCGVLAAHRLGAERIIAMGRHADRTDLARRFGATDVVAARGAEAVEQVKELTRGEGAKHVIEAVGTAQSMATALRIARDGGTIGFVGVPHNGLTEDDLHEMFGRNVALRGGVAPARHYIPELLAAVLAGTLNPAPVFDRTVRLDQTPEGYRAMHDRQALKVMIVP